MPLQTTGVTVVCVEPDSRLRSHLSSAGHTVYADIAAIPANSIDCTYSMNVLEHVEDDRAALAAIYERIRPGGRIIIYVPAFGVLYSKMDELVGHYRRYRRKDLVAKLKEADFQIDTATTATEAVALANDTRYGLAASIWTENINLALDVAPKVKAGSVWINCTNVFDAASGFGGYRESGFGREGGKEGLWEYVKEADRRSVGLAVSDGQAKSPARSPGRPTARKTAPLLDRTAKMYIGGKQARPDGGSGRAADGPQARASPRLHPGKRRPHRRSRYLRSRAGLIAGDESFVDRRVGISIRGIDMPQ